MHGGGAIGEAEVDDGAHFRIRGGARPEEVGSVEIVVRPGGPQRCKQGPEPRMKWQKGGVRARLPITSCEIFCELRSRRHELLEPRPWLLGGEYVEARDQ